MEIAVHEGMDHGDPRRSNEGPAPRDAARGQERQSLRRESPSKVEPGAEDEPEISGGEIRRRVSEVIQELREQGADRPPLVAAPPSRRRPRMLPLALTLVVAAEIAVIVVVGRMDLDHPVVAATPPSPCAKVLAPIETGLERYRAEVGSLPGTLEILVPKYLESLPRPGGTAILRYEARGFGYVLRCEAA
jgi:hypothetical protein